VADLISMQLQNKFDFGPTDSTQPAGEPTFKLERFKKYHGFALRTGEGDAMPTVTLVSAPTNRWIWGMPGPDQ
jgi:hypothetical protein